MEMTLTSPEGQLRLPLPAYGLRGRVASILPVRSTTPLLPSNPSRQRSCEGKRAETFARVLSTARVSIIEWDLITGTRTRRLLREAFAAPGCAVVLLMRNRWQWGGARMRTNRGLETLLRDFNFGKGRIVGKLPGRLLKTEAFGSWNGCSANSRKWHWEISLLHYSRDGNESGWFVDDFMEMEMKKCCCNLDLEFWGQFFFFCIVFYFSKEL